MANLLRLLAKLPLGILYRLAPALYALLYYGLAYRKNIVLQNLRNSFPKLNTGEITELAKSFYRNYADVVVESIKALTISNSALTKRVKITNLHIIDDYLIQGQSVIVTFAHHCNLEWLMMTSSIKLKCPLDAVYKPLHDGPMEKLVLESRSRFGGAPIPAKSTLIEIIKRKNEVRGFAIAPDQTPRSGDEKYWTTFLNQDTAFFTGVEKIARLTKYPVLFIKIIRVKRGYYEADIKTLATPPYNGKPNEITERYVREVEQQILNHPADWLWSHKRWKHKKPLYP